MNIWKLVQDIGNTGLILGSWVACNLLFGVLPPSWEQFMEAAFVVFMVVGFALYIVGRYMELDR